MIKYLALGLGSLLSYPVLSCALCGLNQSFSPKMLLVSTGFVVLPAFFAAFIAWRIFQDSKK